MSEIQATLVSLCILCGGLIGLFGYRGWRNSHTATRQLTEDLANAQAARIKAEEASRAKDSLLATVSHELRNPLNSIMLWCATLLRDQALSENTRRGLLAIERAVRTQTQLIEDLLDLLRIESGRLRLNVQNVDLGEVVHVGVESMRAAAEAKSINIQDTIDPDIGVIAGDQGRLEQVVWNLVSNAVKFTPNGGRIDVRLERIGAYAEIVVADTGRGIEPECLSSVFERFWQGEGQGERQQGVGLGLSIVKEIVSLHGGAVFAHSEGRDKGSAFRVRLPVPANPASSPIPRPAQSPMTSAATTSRLDRTTIVVVDDDPEACEALKDLLASFGAHVLPATSAQAALAAIGNLHPDAVVSDIAMPLEDGYFLAREIRKREETCSVQNRVPLIALTAYGRVEDKVEILAAGYDDHLVKPADPTELSAVLRTLIIARGGLKTERKLP